MWFRLQPVALLLISSLLVVLLTLLLRHTGWQSYVLEFLSDVEQAGIAGQLGFILVVALCVVLLVPSVVFSMGAGYIFGVMHGSVLVVIAEVLGATIAYLIAHYSFGERAEKFIHSQRSLDRISAIMVDQGWRAIALLCVLPFFPFKLSSYLFGLSPLALREFQKGMLIGLWPLTFFNVYLGSLSAKLMSAPPPIEQQTEYPWIVSAIGFVVVMSVLALIIILAQKSIHKIEHRSSQASASSKQGNRPFLH